ncbi:putative aldouronate transport system permease protein [Paenibacillus phyllosphaerae]|uniref:Putative aldouronate transport system permease protein n=1 Tax=Paenibacillus phyllosphaerae TaxID=274593 RepID=A0A7W5B3K5_9BACL|nr:putative aldouronate transport system permease protein [Paenibacillus phyllosphaerae]
MELESAATKTLTSRERTYVWKRFKKQWPLHVFVGLGMVFLLIFSYTPMFGIIMAFKDYSIVTGIKGIFTSDWVGLRYFEEFVNDYRFVELVRNTLVLSFLKVIFAFPAPILFAILLNEVKNMAFKRFVQTVSYLPHFISWVVVVGIAFSFLSTDIGILNKLLVTIGLIDQPLDILTGANYFWGLAVSSAIWKEMGWWTIIFLASIAGINPALYEAAQIDGAGRLSRIRHITLPGIKGTIVVVLILTIGSILGGGLVGSNFEQAYLLGNDINNSTSEIVQTYAFKVGLADGRFSYAAAIDLIQSVISVILIFSSNTIAKRVSGSSLF